MNAARDTFVYWIYGGDELLYIGMTRNLTKRYKDHKHHRPAVFLEATHCRAKGPYTRLKAHHIEAVAIRRQRPVFNAETREKTGERHRRNRAAWAALYPIAGSAPDDTGNPNPPVREVPAPSPNQ